MLIAIILAILWLLHRATRLLKVPAPALIHVLGIDIPETPRVSLDGITSSSINLHWTAPTISREKSANVVKYIVQVDGRNVGEVDRLDTKLTLKDLRPATKYVIRVVAVNSSNYRSHPATLVTHTLREEESSDVSGSTMHGFWTIGTNNIATSSGVSLSTTTAANGTITSRQRSQSKSVVTKPSGKDREKEKDKNKESRAYSIEGLTQEVESVQTEINELLMNAANLEEDFEKNQSTLLQELDRLKSVKKTDDQHRSQLKAETKLLEESKRALEAQRTKVDKQRKQLELEFAKREELQTQWETSLAESDSKLKALETKIENHESENTVEFAAINHRILEKQEMLIKLETEINQTTAEIENIDTNKDSTLIELESLKESVDPITGLISDDSQYLKFIKNENILPKAKEALKEDLRIDQELEVEWQATQKSLELRYVEVNRAYSNAKSTFDRAQTQQQQQQKQFMFTPVSNSASRRNSVNSRAVIDQQPLIQQPVTPRMSAYGNLPYPRTTQEHTNMTPSVDMLLPSNLFTGGDGDADEDDREDRSHITEHFAREIALNDQQHEEFDASTPVAALNSYYGPAPNRASASLLATAFQYGNSPAESLRSTTVSPKASGLSLREKAAMGSGAMNETYAPFMGYQGSVHSLLDADGRSVHSDTGRRTKKAGSLFFNKNAGPPPVEIEANSVDAVSRARGNSLSSSVFSPWADQGMLRPSISGNDSVLSVDASNWSVFDKVAPRKSVSSSLNQDNTLTTPMERESSYNSSSDSVFNSMAGITTGDTSNSKNSRKGLKGFFLTDKDRAMDKDSPQSPTKDSSPWGKFDKSIAALFTDDKEKDKEKEKDREKEKEKEKEKESILQKSMRSFSSSRKSSSSSKFVRRLSLFGKKGDHRNDLEGLEIPELTIVEDEDEDKKE